ncbi:MAG: hypothetical protein ACKVY0_20470 [Prosthecobacter sp.]|uniref:hypothetical protein n=1 Tax=Prosthecobacter sp. TaxID=1965333 RepID=UPI0039037DB0
MKASSATPSAPSFLWRAATLLGLWLLIFGAIIAITPLHMEGGYNVTYEKLKATLCAPFLGWFGMAAFLGGHRPSYVPAIISLLIILGSTLLMLFRCRTTRTFWILTAVHIIIVTVSSIGFSQVTRYWNENP